MEHIYTPVRCLFSYNCTTPMLFLQKMVAVKL